MRAPIEQRLASIWQRRGAAAWLLAPLAAVYFVVLALRRTAFALRIAPAQALPVPVAVIGNLYVGGTGKTPLAIALLRALRARGWQPGLVSRGHGRDNDEIRLVHRDDSPRTSGDEPLLIARAGGAPVAVGRIRAEAARALLREHPDCDCLLSDDGLQHLALARDLEIAVVDARGLGNGWVLPAGPLRDAPGRLAQVDAIVVHGTDVEAWRRLGPPCFGMRSRLQDAWQLRAPAQRRELRQFTRACLGAGVRVVAAAGIGVPERFFSMLREQGIDFDAVSLPDHFEYRSDPFAALAADCILITEKDAVKCAADARWRDDARFWVVSLQVDLDPGLIDFVQQRLRLAQQEKSRGSSPA